MENIPELSISDLRGAYLKFKSIYLSNLKRNSKNNIFIDVSDFILNQREDFYCKIDEYENCWLFFKNLEKAISSQCSYRNLRVACYGFDWILYDKERKIFITDIYGVKHIDDQIKLNEIGFKNGTTYKVIDLSDKLKQIDSKFIKRKYRNTFLYADISNGSFKTCTDIVESKYVEIIY